MSRKFSGSIASAAVLSGFPVRLNEHKGVSVQVVAAGTTCTLVYEWSNDKTTWYAASGFAVDAASRQPVQSSTGLGLWFFPRMGAFFRVRCSVYGSGTPSVTCEVLDNEVPPFNDLPLSADWNYAAAAAGILNTTTAVTIKAAVAGKRNYLDSMDLSAEALGAATELAIRDGAGGTVLWRTKIGTGGLVGGRTLRFTRPLKSTVNTLLEVVTLTASVTGAVYFNAQGRVAD